jgi:hypothetical protein
MKSNFTATKIVELIESRTMEGDGKEFPFREVTWYHDKYGILKAIHDPCGLWTYSSGLVYLSKISKQAVQQ